MVFYWILIAVALGGLLIGATRPWLRAAPWLVTALAVAGYGALVAVAGTWAGGCWDCTYGYESTRAFVFWVWAVFGAGFAVTLIGSAWAGAAISTLLHGAR
jgi:hypothetical protein